MSRKVIIQTSCIEIRETQTENGDYPIIVV